MLNMEFSEVTINGKSVKFKNSGKHWICLKDLKGKNKLKGSDIQQNPNKHFYFTGQGENLQIWTQGQGRYTSHWLPSFMM